MKITWKGVVLLLGALLFGFFFRWGEDRVAAGPIACANWRCKDVYVWYLDDLGTTVHAAETAGTPGVPAPAPPSAHTTQAVPLIYTPASAGTLPLIGAGTYDLWIWSNNNPMCNQIGGAWPVPGEVTAAGTETLTSTGLNRNKCS